MVKLFNLSCKAANQAGVLWTSGGFVRLVFNWMGNVEKMKFRVYINYYTKFGFDASGAQTGGTNTSSTRNAIIYSAFLFGLTRRQAGDGSIINF